MSPNGDRANISQLIQTALFRLILFKKYLTIVKKHSELGKKPNDNKSYSVKWFNKKPSILTEKHTTTTLLTGWYKLSSQKITAFSYL